jgi:hypothetical protein
MHGSRPRVRVPPDRRHHRLHTAYLARGEIEHAPTIAGDLLETLIGRLEPPFRLAKFEGDAGAAQGWMPSLEKD